MWTTAVRSCKQESKNDELLYHDSYLAKPQQGSLGFLESLLPQNKGFVKLKVFLLE